MINPRISFLHLISFLLFLPPAFSTTPIAKPESRCLDRCGKVLIPYPFGMGRECSLNLFFEIICNNSTNPPKAYFLIFSYIEIVEINLNKSQVRVRYPNLLTLACYGNSGELINGSGDAWKGLILDGSPFTFSDENWLTAIGCDDLMLGIATNDLKFGNGCVSYCNKGEDYGGVGFCPDNDYGNPAANGCCRSAVPGGITELGAQLSDLSRKWRDRKLFPCSYVFIQEKAEVPNQSNFSYPLSYLNSPSMILDDEWEWKTRPPPVMRWDWRIFEADNCSEAHSRGAEFYVCRNNSVCVDFDPNVRGYLCRCKQGYEGNPYLTHGCRDIDECGDHRTNPCHSKSICHNVAGSVECLCRKGYYGDGMKDGSGCTLSKLIIIFIGVASGLGFLLLVSACYLLRKALKKRRKKMRKNKFFKQNGGILLQKRTCIAEGISTFGKTKLFLAEELAKATDNFNESRILGQGGQGIVYKGMLADGKIVAIKKSKLVNKDQLDQFINEVVILSQINHRNVVKLLGCCLETEIPLLVYEFMPNGTLSDLIRGSKVGFPVSWNMRLKIAADVAGAFAYLHSASSTPIYHRDIKSSNILFDEKYVVKVSDFGISRNVGVDQTHLTTRVNGTFGYFDPEYFRSNQFTEKSDVYSFGVVLVELLTGQRPICRERGEDDMSLVMRFLECVEDNNLDAILDRRVLEQGGEGEVRAVVLLARRCLNLEGKMRPTMKEAATELESLRLSEMPTNVCHESEEGSVNEAKTMMISDIEYTWTTSDICELPPSSSDMHPLIFEIV